MRLKYSIILSLLILFKGVSYAQEELRFNHLTTESGLTNNIVSCTLQDSTGYIWFGTIDGLCRYDGNTFVNYLHKNHDSNSITDNEITCLCEDAEHRVWIGTTYGLSCFNPVTKKFTNYYFDKSSKIPASNYISVLYPDNYGIVWVGTRKGLYKINASSGQCTNVKITPDKFNNIFIHGIGSTKEGRLFVAFVSDVLYSDDRGNSFIPAVDISNEVKKDHISSFYLDKKERLWLGIWGHSILYEINAHTLAVKKHVFDSASVKDRPGNAAHVTRLLNDSILMIGAIVSGEMESGSLYFLNPENNKCIKYLHNKHDPYSISNNHIYSLFVDKQQTVWIGTVNGINYFNRKLSNFNQLSPHAGEDSTMFSGYTLLVNDDKNNLWMSTADDKLLFYKPYNKNTFSSAKPEMEVTIPNTIESILSICPVGDSILIGTTRGMVIFNIVEKTFNCSPVLPDSLKTIQRFSIPSMFKDNKGLVWFGTFQDGVFSYNPLNKETRHYYLYKEDANSQNKNTNYVDCLTEDAEGNIWAGASDNGYYRIAPSSGKVDLNIGLDGQADFKSLGSISSIFCDTNDLIYFGTSRNGLMELNVHNKNINYYTVENGLSNDDIARIIPWGKNYLLLTTKKGLSVFNKTSKTFRNYFKANGLFSDFFRFNAGLINSGEVFVSSEYCLEYFDPSDLFESNLKIYPGFTSMQVNNKEYTGDLSQKISLGYRDNIVSFTFSAFDFINNEEDKFAYKLKGLDEDWNYCGNRRYAEYTNLPGGDYILELKVQTTDGSWVETAHPILLHIATPYWKTWWFFMLCGIGAFALGYLFYYLKMQRKLEAEKLRTRLARDLHDDIGSSLSSISILSDMAGKSTSASAEETQVIFNKISESSHKTMESMKDIVWTVNPENDAVESLLARMRIYCSEILEPKGIEYDFKADEDVQNIKLEMEQRRNFYLIFKEAINNIAKYSRCNNVNIGINKSVEKIEMKIKDDGVGFNTVDILNRGNGLKNMNERAKLMKGSFIIESALGNGTTLTLAFPIT